MRTINMQRGSHHLVVVLVSMALIIGIVGILGVKAYQKESDAAAPSLSSRYCRSLGRVFQSGVCRKTCQAGAGSFKTGKRYDYCSAAASALTRKKCNQLGRVHIADKCLKGWTRSAKKSPIAPCQDGYFSYIVGNPYDKCSAARNKGLKGVWS